VKCSGLLWGAEVETESAPCPFSVFSGSNIIEIGGHVLFFVTCTLISLRRLLAKTLNQPESKIDLIDLTMFKLIKNQNPSRFRHSFLERRLKILKFHFLKEKVSIPELEWQIPG
jgi:hypothetical protein